MTQDMVKMMSQDKMIGRREILFSSPSPWFSRFLRTMLLLLMMTVGVGKIWGQDYSGTYYIANKIWNGEHDTSSEVGFEDYFYSPSKPDKNWYLVPARNPHQAKKEDAFYSGDSYATSGDPAKPFLTTNRTNRDNNSIWVITKTGSKYLIKHLLTGKYLKYEPPVSSKPKRQSVHLEAVAGDTPPTGNEYQFTITTKTEGDFSGYSIKPTTADGTVISGYLNPAGDNWPYYFSHLQNKEKIWCTGIVGYWTSEGGGSLWIFEDVNDYKYKPDFSYNTDNQIVITYPESYDAIYYTTDGSEPPTSGDEHKYTVPFNPPADATSIKAVAVKDGVASPVSIYTLPYFLGSTHKYIIQSKSCKFYNMISNLSVDANTKNVSTLNVPCSTMAWHFENAADEDGQYYYIVSETGNSEKWYMYYTTDNNSNKHIYLKNTNDGSDNYKFNIDANPIGGYNLIPKGQAKALYKSDPGSNDAGLKPIRYDGNINDATSRWDIVGYSTANLPLWEDEPFTESTQNETNYYKIVSVKEPSKPIILNSSNVVTSQEVTTGLDERKTMWVIMKVENDGDELLDFYTFQNAFTGEKLYYNGNGRLSQTATFQLGQPSVEGADETWSHFVIVQTFNDYNIIPRAIVDNVKSINRTTPYSAFNCLNRSNGDDVLGTFYDDGDGSRWTFSQVDFCMPPVFEETGTTITLSCATNGAEIHYTTDGTEPSAESALYENGWDSSTKNRIKAIAVVKSGETVTASSDVVTLLNKPDVTLEAGPYTYNGVAWEPTVTKVSIGESESETDAYADGDGIDPATYTRSYSSDHTNVGTFTVTLEDKVEGRMYVWNASATFDITPKAITVTADNGTKVYGEVDPTLTATIAGRVSEEDEIICTISRAEGEIVDEYVITPAGEALQGNYSVSYNTALFTITKKDLTITADDATMEYDGTVLTKDTYTNTALATGDVIESVIVTGSQTEKGNSLNVPSDAVIKNGNGVDVTACYEITYMNGTLSVTGKVITITADSDTKVYDGTPLTKNSYTYDNTKLYSGDAISSVIVSGSQTVAGSSDNEPSGAVIVNTNNNNEDVTENYHIIYVKGTLTVTQKALTITADDATKVYDGTALTKNSYTNTDLVVGDAITSVTVAGSQTDVGTNDNVPSSAVIKNAAEEEVTLSYSITYTNGTLEVTGKPVTITAKNASKTYDGTALTESEFTASDLETGDTHTFIVEMTAESTITDVGTQPNVIATVDGVAVTTGEESVVGNYLVTTADGTLNIDAKSIGNGSLADGFSLNIGAENTISLYDGTKELTKDTHYTIDADVTTSVSGRYSIRTIRGTGNYGGSVDIRNAIAHFMNDGNGGSEYSATFVAEPAGADNDPPVAADDTKGHALPDGITAYVITAIEGSVVVTEALDYIPEGVPVLLLSNTNVSGFLVEDATVTEEQKITDAQKTANMLEEVKTGMAGFVSDTEDSNYQKAHFNVKTIYLLYMNEFVYNMEGYLAKGKVYLNPNHPNDPSTASTSPSPTRLMIMWGEDNGIDTSHLSPLCSQLPDMWYSIDGRRLSGKPTRKGLYLKNGQKIVVR